MFLRRAPTHPPARSAPGRRRASAAGLLLAGVLAAAGPSAGSLGAQSVSNGQPGPAAARGMAGEVVQAESGLPIEGATVVLVASAVAGGDPAGGPFVAATRSALTNAAGQYRFDGVPPGAYVLRVVRLGFRPATVEVELRGDPALGTAPGANARVSVGLTVVPIRLRPVAVAVAAPEPYARHARTAQAAGDARLAALRQRQGRYLSTDVREVTHADVAEGVTLGETDLFRALQRLPGVSTRNDYTAELWIRGARWDQTRVTFDGLPLYNPLHVGGLLSAVNADAVGAAFLHPGVRPAALGEGSAAVLDLRSRPGGGAGAVRGVGEVSLLSARATLDQRVAGGRGAWMLAGRRSYYDVLFPAVSPLFGTKSSDARFPYHFGELAGRADWRLGARHALEVSALRSQDYLTRGPLDDPVRARWGNTAARVTLAGPALAGPLGSITLRHTLGVSAYEGRVRPGALDSAALGADWRRLQPVRADVTYASLAGEVAPAGDGPAPWGAGYELSAQRARTEGALYASYTRDARDSVRSRVAAAAPQVAVWGERRLRPGARLAVAAGLRAEAGPAVPDVGPLGVVRLAPRLTARYAVGDSQTFVSAGAGRSYQYVQALTPAAGPGYENVSRLFDVERPVPLWVAAGSSLDGAAAPALRTDLATLGAERWIGAGWQASANAYARRTAGLLVENPRPGTAAGEPLFVAGGEAARGVEVGVRKLTGRWTLAGGYAFSRAHTTAFGFDFPSPEDRRHVLNATTMLRVGRGLRLGAACGAFSGAPFTRGTAGGLTYGALADSLINGLAPFLPDSALHYAPGTREAPGAGRTPPFARLDLLVDWAGRVRQVRVGAFAQVHNATFHANPAGYAGSGRYCSGTTLPGPDGRCPIEDGFGDGLPVVPVIGLRFSF